MATPSVSSASDDDTDESDGGACEVKPTLEVRAREGHRKVAEQDDWRRRCESLATTHLRNRSTLPPDWRDSDKSWAEVDVAVRLPCYYARSRDASSTLTIVMNLCSMLVASEQTRRIGAR